MPAHKKQPPATPDAAVRKSRNTPLAGLGRALGKKKADMADRGVAARHVKTVSAPPANTPSAPSSDPLAEAFRDVKPLAPHNRAIIKRPLPRSGSQASAGVRVRESAAQQSAFSAPSPETLLEAGQQDSYAVDGISRRNLADLRRGRWPVENIIDLHGLTRDEAAAALGEFIDMSVASGMRYVRVIHGRGLSSPDGQSILKQFSRYWLMQHPGVLAFRTARAQDGGAGALQVLLRTNSHD